MRINKTKIILLSVFIFCLLPFQSGLALEYSDCKSSISGGSGDRCGSCVNYSKGEGNNYDSNKYCVFPPPSTISQSAPENILKYQNWNEYMSGLNLQEIKVPYASAVSEQVSEQSVWEAIKDASNIVGQDNNPTEGRNKTGLDLSDCNTAGLSGLVQRLQPYITYNKVKEMITRSCLRGTITTQTPAIITRFKCTHHYCKTCSIGFGTCCHDNERDVTPDNTKYKTWTFDGCKPLEDKMSLTVNITPTPEKTGAESYRSGRIEVAKGGEFTLSWSLSNSTADCTMKGKSATFPDDPTKALNIIIKPGQVPTNGTWYDSRPFQNVKSGIYTYTLECSGVVNGANSSKTDVRRKEVTIYTTDVPAPPKINDFSFVSNENLMTPTAPVHPQDYDIILGKTFELQWDVEDADPKIADDELMTVYRTKQGSREQPVPIFSTRNAKDMKTGTEPLEIETKDLAPEKLYTFTLEAQNTKFPELPKAALTLKIYVKDLPDPTINKFEFIDSQGNIMDMQDNAVVTPILPTDQVKIKWNVADAKNLIISGKGINPQYPGLILSGESELIQPGKGDNKPTEHPYIITAFNLKAASTNNPSKKITITTKMPEKPEVKIEFEEKNGILQNNEKGATLVWEVSDDAKTITINGSGLPNNYQPASPKGSYVLAVKGLPIKEHKYTIKACPESVAIGETNCSIAGTALKIYSPNSLFADIKADANLIRKSRSTSLNWTVTKNDNADSYTVTSSDGAVIFKSTEPITNWIGSQLISPTEKTTYTLTVKSKTALINDFTATVAVDVTEAEPPGAQFSADKTEIEKGETVTLSWKVSGASEVAIDHGIGKVQNTGTAKVHPSFTTTYALTAKSPIAIVPAVKKTVTIKVKSPGIPEIEEPKILVEPTLPEFKEPEGGPAGREMIDLKVNGVDGPVTLNAPAAFKLSWNLNKYCLATGSWLGIKLKAGSENITVKKNGKYTYSLYCPGAGTDSAVVNVVGGTGENANTGLLDALLGRGDKLAKEPMPVAEAYVSTDRIIYSKDIKVIRGQPTDIYIKVDEDISAGMAGSRDASGGWSYLMTNQGRCLYNTDLIKGAPQFGGVIESPISPDKCNVRLGNFTFNDEPGAYRYGIFRLVQNDNKFSNISYANITVENPPLPETAPIIDLRINGNDQPEQILGTPANYLLSWDVINADYCEASGSWSGSKALKDVQSFVSSVKKDFNYTLTCVGKLGTTAKSIVLKVVESPICSFTALPPTINKKSAFITESELSWKCEYADECSLSPAAIEKIKTYGSTRVSPDQTMTYVLTCANSAVSKSFKAEVKVEE